MRLVIATPLYPPEIGGPATYATLLEAGLPPRGIEVELVKFSDVRHLPKLLRHIAYYTRVKRALRRADLALALDPVSVGLPTMLAARALGKPYAVKVVGDYAWEQGRQRFGVTAELDEFVTRRQRTPAVRLLQWCEYRVARRAERVIAPSAYLRRIVCAWGVRAGQVEVIYNAVSLGEMGRVPVGVARMPHPLIVAAGRLVPWKGFEGLIEAVALARTHGVAATLAIIGEGPSRGTLEAYITAHLPGAALLTGALSHADTLATIAAADIFVLNSTYEGLSHLLIEAAALARPIIATEVGGNPEVITDGETGLLVPAGDAPHLASVLQTLLGDPALRARLAANAAMSARRFSEAAMLDATAALLTRLADPGHAMRA